MEPQDNKLLSLQKAINSHEQAVAGLTDAEACLPEALYATMLERIQKNIQELHAEAARSHSGDEV